MWCSRALGYFIVCLRCLIFAGIYKGLEHFLIFLFKFFDWETLISMLFVVAGPLQVLNIFVEKSILNAICRGRRYFRNFSVCLGCSFLMLFVVAGHGLFFLVFLQKIILNAICRGRRYFWKAQLEVESVIFGILLWF